MLAFGLWLVHLGHWGYGASWVDASLGLLAATAILGASGGQKPKQARKLAARLAAEGARTTPELRTLLDRRLARAANYLSPLFLLTIIVPMVL